jgi:hypothetical protein
MACWLTAPRSYQLPQQYLSLFQDGLDRIIPRTRRIPIHFESAFHDSRAYGPWPFALVPINRRIGIELFKQLVDNRTQCIVADGLDSTLVLSERIIERDFFFGQPCSSPRLRGS